MATCRVSGLRVEGILVLGFRRFRAQGFRVSGLRVKGVRILGFGASRHESQQVIWVTSVDAAAGEVVNQA